MLQGNLISSMASKPINICWIKTSSHLSFIASYYRQFSTNIKMKNCKVLTSFVSLRLLPLRSNKTGFNLTIFLFQYPRKAVYITINKYFKSHFTGSNICRIKSKYKAKFSLNFTKMTNKIFGEKD